MKLNITPISTTRFFYDPATKKFMADRSDLHDVRTIFNPIYNDCCDVGISLKSSKTGRVVTYYLDNEYYGEDGEVDLWRFFPLPESIKEVPECRDTSVFIFND